MHLGSEHIASHVLTLCIAVKPSADSVEHFFQRICTLLDIQSTTVLIGDGNLK